MPATTEVRVLNGGLAGWLAAGQPTESGAGVAVVPGDFDAEPGQRPQVNGAQIVGALTTGNALRPGRRPGAGAVRRRERTDRSGRRAHPGRDQSTGRRKTWTPTAGSRPPEAIRDRYAGLDAEAVLYCGSGINAAQTLLALESAGLTAAIYPGSWSEWITDPTGRSPRANALSRHRQAQGRFGPPNMISSQLGTEARLRLTGRFAGSGSALRPRTRATNSSASSSRSSRSTVRSGGPGSSVPGSRPCSGRSAARIVEQARLDRIVDHDGRLPALGASASPGPRWRRSARRTPDRILGVAVAAQRAVRGAERSVVDRIARLSRLRLGCSVASGSGFDFGLRFRVGDRAEARGTAIVGSTDSSVGESRSAEAAGDGSGSSVGDRLLGRADQGEVVAEIQGRLGVVLAGRLGPAADRAAARWSGSARRAASAPRRCRPPRSGRAGRSRRPRAGGFAGPVVGGHRPAAVLHPEGVPGDRVHVDAAVQSAVR